MERCVPETQPLFVCFQAHQYLHRQAAALLPRIAPRDDAADLLRLAIPCMRIGAEGALASRDEREAIHNWRNCGLAEAQIRKATYWAMRRGQIGPRDYDATFGAASRAARARFIEIERLRRRISLASLV
jgi:hypothetical protein